MKKLLPYKVDIEKNVRMKVKLYSSDDEKKNKN